MNAEMFPILRAAQPSPARVDEAIAVVAEGLAAGQIRAAALAQARSTLSRAAEQAWRSAVAKPFFYGKADALPGDLLDLYYGIGFMGLHSVGATAKKVARAGVQGPAVEAMRSLVCELQPLADAVASLKGKTGRQPSSGQPSRPQNPNKTVRTCPVCFRPIAVISTGAMAHHGFRRLAPGWQTASCPGVRFRPLEVSSDGLAWFVEALRTREAEVRSALARSGDLEVLTVARRRQGNPETITRGDPKWPAALRSHLAALQFEACDLEREIPALAARLDSWRPTEVTA